MIYQTINRQPILNLFSNRELDEIHSSSLEMLERTGVNIHHPEARELLVCAGAYVKNDLRVRIPPSLVERALQTVPSRIVMCKTTGERTMFLEKHRTYFGTGSDLKFTIDHKTGHRRMTVLQDIADSARVSDALDNIDFIMSYGLASDVDVVEQEILQFVAMLKNSTKPMILTTFSEKKVLENIYKIACIIAGSENEFTRSPFFLVYGQFLSPFQHHKEGLERLLFCAEKKIPLIYIPTVIAGASGPVTMAGSIALGNAETLAGLTIHQLKNPGAPFVYGGCICPFDMKVGGFTYGAPEWHMADIVLCQLSTRYNLPIFTTGGCTDSKIIDAQAIVEGTFSILLEALAGGNLIHDVGYLETGFTGALDYLVIMDEVISMTRRVLQNFRVDTDSLALDLVDKVGPGKDFIQEDHTLEHFKEEVWYPRLFDRRVYDRWKADGGLTTEQKAKTRVLEILEKHPTETIDKSKMDQIEELLRR